MQRSRSIATSGESSIGFWKWPLLVDHAALARAPAHRDVLQRAFAAFVADRAVERVVDE
jgi:hypothetical protein